MSISWSCQQEVLSAGLLAGETVSSSLCFHEVPCTAMKLYLGFYGHECHQDGRAEPSQVELSRAELSQAQPSQAEVKQAELS